MKSSPHSPHLEKSHAATKTQHSQINKLIHFLIKKKPGVVILISDKVDFQNKDYNKRQRMALHIMNESIQKCLSKRGFMHLTQEHLNM